MKGLVCAAVIMLAAVCTVAAAPPGERGPEANRSDREDAAILRDAVRQVNTYTRLTVFDAITIAVQSGVVTLTGDVTAPYKKQQIARRVERVDGMVELQNQINVLPVSQDDDELRYRIAASIYGNPSFWEYAALANPPIHIIVAHGHVTLVGVVRTDVERVLARSLASVFGVRSITNNLKTEAEIRAMGPV